MSDKDKIAGIMGICNRWTQYHKSLRAHWKTITYDDVTDMLVNPIISIIQGLSTTTKREENGN